MDDDIWNGDRGKQAIYLLVSVSVASSEGFQFGSYTLHVCVEHSSIAFDTTSY